MPLPSNVMRYHSLLHHGTGLNRHAVLLCVQLRGSLSGMQSQLRQRTSAADAKPDDAGRDHDCGDAVDTKGAAGSSMAMNLILLVLGLLIGYFVARS